MIKTQRDRSAVFSCRLHRSTPTAVSALVNIVAVRLSSSFSRTATV